MGLGVVVLTVRSILLDILDTIRDLQDPTQIRKVCLARIKASKINAADKANMIKYISSTADFKLLSCIYNLILKYEGNGVL